jgi:hypothetical protein
VKIFVVVSYWWLHRIVMVYGSTLALARMSGSNSSHESVFPLNMSVNQKIDDEVTTSVSLKIGSIKKR